LDNAHWNRIAALGQALNEMRREGESYADQVVKNARALGLALYEQELPVKYVDLGVTQSHQVLLSQAGMERKYDRSLPESAKILEESNIIVDSVGRLGTNEITRLGMTEEDMTEVAVLVSRALSGENVRDEVVRSSQSLEIQYT
jgi:glycine hydroxymethyltransferase